MELVPQEELEVSAQGASNSFENRRALKVAIYTFASSMVLFLLDASWIFDLNENAAVLCVFVPVSRLLGSNAKVLQKQS